MSAADKTSLSEIEAVMGLGEDESLADPIAREDVMRWMGSEDIHALGAVQSMIHNKQHYMRIDPYLTFEDYQKFSIYYYERCIRENPDSEWADTRYEAGWDFVNWFKGIWKDKSVPRDALTELRDWLKSSYENGDEAVRECLITAVFEHLFADKKIRRFFSGWQEDPSMADAYKTAVGYAAGMKTRSGMFR